MYSMSAVTIWTQAKRWTAKQRRLIVELVNRNPDLYQPLEIGNTRQAVNSYCVIFRTLAAAETFSREWGWSQKSEATRMRSW